jgi:hypothetical protein
MELVVLKWCQWYNGIITLNGSAPNATVESNLTFDGNTLSLTGGLAVNGTLDVTGQVSFDYISIFADVATFTKLKYISTLTDSTGYGEVMFNFGLNTGISAGDLVYFDGTNWKGARANAVSTSGNRLLGIALGSLSGDGVLLRGYVRYDSKFPTPTAGNPLYIGTTISGDMQTSKPSGSGQVVRIVGYGMGTGDAIYFCPDNTWVEIV